MQLRISGLLCTVTLLRMYANYFSIHCISDVIFSLHNNNNNNNNNSNYLQLLQLQQQQYSSNNNNSKNNNYK